MAIEHICLRLFEAVSVMAGAWLVSSGVRTQILRRRRSALRGPTELLWLARSFRRVVMGLALIGVGAGLFWHVGWLVTLSLIIGGEEVLESSVMAAALRDEEKRREAEARAHHAALARPHLDDLPALQCTARPLATT